MSGVYSILSLQLVVVSYFVTTNSRSTIRDFVMITASVQFGHLESFIMNTGSKLRKR